MKEQPESDNWYFFHCDGSAAVAKMGAAAFEKNSEDISEDFRLTFAPEEDQFQFVDCFRLDPKQALDGVFWDEVPVKGGSFFTLIPMQGSTREQVAQTEAFLRREKSVAGLNVIKPRQWVSPKLAEIIESANSRKAQTKPAQSALAFIVDFIGKGRGTPEADIA